MGDLIKNSVVFSKLGFDSMNQWVLYHEPLQNFYSWLAKSIKHNNILTEHEIFAETELKANGTWYEGEDLEKRLKTLDQTYPGVLKYTEEDVENLEREVEHLEELQQMYSDLNSKLKTTKLNVTREVCDLEYAIREHEDRKDQAYNRAVEKAKELHELQKENISLNDELEFCFTKQQTPPLFIHQMPLEEYFVKCDSFLQYLTTYMNGNLKIRTSLENDLRQEEPSQTINELEKLRKQFYDAEMKLVNLKIRSAGHQSMIDEMDISKIHVMNITQIKKEIRELDLSYKHYYDTTLETLKNDLKVHVQQLAQQQIEFVLYENTKLKHERATVRLENVKALSRRISDALHNAEVLWILMQIDIEKAKNRLVNTSMASIASDNNSCSKRIEAMLEYQLIPNNFNSTVYINRMADILSEHLKSSQKPNSTKTCLYEYERFCRLSSYALKSMIAKKHYSSELKMLENLKSIEEILSVHVFDGPTDEPVFESMQFLKPFYKVKRSKVDIENTIRKLRTDIQENITEKMRSDRLWRFQQILWIWFLTEPKRVLQAIEDINKEASKASNFKTLSGIKRKE